MKILEAGFGVFVLMVVHASAHTHGHEVEKTSWKEVEKEELLPGLLRQFVHGKQSMLVRFDFKEGSTVPIHSHPNEQITYVESGKMVFTIGDKEETLEAGDLVVIPPNVPHGGKVVEDTIEFDVFAPPRLDWITGQEYAFKGQEAPKIESPYKTKKTLAGSEIGVVKQLDFRPGNLAVLPDGRIVFSLHPMGVPQKYKVLELLPDGTTKPFPNETYAQAVDEETGIGFDAVIGVESDQYGRVWMLDMGGVDGHPAKLVVWNTRGDELLYSIPVPRPVMQGNSFMQDLAIDLKHEKIYIADMTRSGMIDENNPAIVSVDLKTGQSRRVLFEHASLNPDEKKPFVIDGIEMGLKDGEGKEHGIFLGLNPITIDPKNEWVYYGAMNSGDLYRIPAAVLADESLSAEEVRAKVERYGDKPVCDGIVAGADGKIYTTAVNEDAIHYTDESGKSQLLAKSPELSWPDGMSVGPDGMIYVTVDQLGRVGGLNKGEDRTKAGEFYIVRLSPAGKVAIGR
ncbi:MAG: L-dopachrome tautomerase-related protein [Verrucomicrobiota bacterium]